MIIEEILSNRSCDKKEKKKMNNFKWKFRSCWIEGLQKDFSIFSFEEIIKYEIIIYNKKENDAWTFIFVETLIVETRRIFRFSSMFGENFSLRFLYWFTVVYYLFSITDRGFLPMLRILSTVYDHVSNSSNLRVSITLGSGWDE